MVGQTRLRRMLDQVGALPIRLHDDGFIEVMLITSTDTPRWIIPKTWAVPDVPPDEVAASEAREAAGLIGTASPEPVGEFCYDRRLPSGIVLPCRVSVHLLKVSGQLDNWPGRGRRELLWQTSRDAAKRICNLSLQRLIARIGRSPELLRPTAGRSRKESERTVATACSA